MDIYNSAGYLDVPALLGTGAQMIVCIGARRIGKTYGFLEYYTRDIINNNGDPIVYGRLRDTQIQLAATAINNPWIPINRNNGYDIDFDKVGNQYLVRQVTERNEKGQAIAWGKTIAQARSIYDSRGIASGGYQAIIVDEFIPERGAIERKHAGYNLKSTIQSLSDRRTDLRIILLANANNLDNDILSEFGLITPFEEMTRNGEMTRLIMGGAVLLVNAYNSPVSAEMAKTPMGKILNTGEYGAMAYSNEFATTNLDNICTVNLREYKPYLRIGGLLIYRHKGANKYHVTQHIGHENVRTILDSNRTYWEIMANYPALKIHCEDGKITFDTFDSKRKFFRSIKENIQR